MFPFLCYLPDSRQQDRLHFYDAAAHAYIASGMIPAWYLVAVNLQTGEEKVLLESPTERVMDVVERFPGAWVIVPQEQGQPRREYWLHHGQAPKSDDTPPWPPQPSPWDKGAKSKPQVYYDQIDPDADGNATLWFRTAEDAAKTRSEALGAGLRPRRNGRPKVSRESGDLRSAQWLGQETDHSAGTGHSASGGAGPTPQDLGWKAIRLEGVPTYPHRINPLSLLPDGRL